MDPAGKAAAAADASGGAPPRGAEQPQQARPPQQTQQPQQAQQVQAQQVQAQQVQAQQVQAQQARSPQQTQPQQAQPQQAQPQQAQQLRTQPQQARPLLGRFGALLAELFPEPPRPPASSPARKAAVTVAYAVCLFAGAALLLARYTGKPPWQTIYGEEMPVYLVGALSHPWTSLVMPYAGYVQLVPRLIAQFVTLLPLRDAAAGFAIAGALVASAVSLFVFRASAGHVRSPLLRGLLVLSVLLLPVALLEIANSGVNTPWYLFVALFWAMLWRPPTRAGTVVAAIVGFAAATSNVVAFAFVLLAIVRVIALPRLREQAVTAAWAAGCLFQVPFVLYSIATGQESRLATLASPVQAARFYGHDVLLPAFGWHLSWLLRQWAGLTNATLLAALVIVIATAVALITGTRQSRVFIVAALGFGFAFAFAAATITWWVTKNASLHWVEPGSRYTALPILLIDAAAVVAVDTWCRTRSRHRATSIIAVAGLIAVLAVGWVSDFRYMAQRTRAPAWAPTADLWLRTCQQHDAVQFIDGFLHHQRVVIPCSAIRR